MSSSRVARLPLYYKVMEDQAKFLQVLFKTVLPDVYEEFEEAFLAGKWVDEDPGP